MNALRMLVLATLAALPLASQAQADYPNKPLRIVVPFAAGGTLDNLGRLLAPKLQESLGQPVVIDPRGGGGTAIGTQIVQKAAPDGYTLLFVANSFLILPMVSKTPPWDVFKDFVPVSLVSRVSQVLVAHPSFEANSVKDLVAAAKAAPGKLDFASLGNGSSSHLAVEIFKSQAGIDMQHVPYKGLAPALQDVLAGQVKVFLSNMPDAIPHVRGGKLKGLGLADEKRAPQLPDVPTFAEQGYPGYLVYSWYGLMAPAGTPPAVSAKLHAALSAAVKDPVIVERTGQQAMTIINTPGEEFRKYLQSEHQRYSAQVKALKISID